MTIISSQKLMKMKLIQKIVKKKLKIMKNNSYMGESIDFRLFYYEF